ncbi:hypothetical protein KGQ55_03825, partial [Patescibacteria group bacterium]|nr:hypothetical protein [Patescibacteria group bacterium]
HAAALPALAFFGFLLLDALVLALGWRAYLARRLSRGPSGAKPLRRAAKRARTLFFGAALASIPAPLLAALDLRFAFAWFGGIALATFALGARRRDSSR